MPFAQLRTSRIESFDIESRLGCHLNIGNREAGHSSWTHDITGMRKLFKSSNGKPRRDEGSLVLEYTADY